VKRIHIQHGVLPYPRRLLALDAIYTWRINEQKRLKAIVLQGQSFRELQLITGLPPAACFEIVSGKAEIDDYQVKAGFRTITKREK
jgi:hypothetical protein